MPLAAADDKIGQNSPGVQIKPPTVFYACLTLGGLLEFLFPYDFPVLSPTVRIVWGLIMGSAGFVFMLVAHEKFKRMGTNIATNRPATIFVVQGAYRFSRNPMYVGGSFFFLGIGVTIGSLWLLVAYLPLGLYLALYVVPREEAYLKRAFGDEYLAYCRNIRRWI